MSTMASAAPEQTSQRGRIGKLTPGARAAAKRSAKQAARVTVKQRAARTGQAAAQAVRDTVATASQGAMQVTGELTELVTEASQNTLAANPLIGLQPRDIASAAKSLLKAIALSRQPVTAHLKGYASELAGVIKGESTVAPDPKDRRFVDPAWQSNFLFRRLLQAHMVTQKGLAQVVEESKLDKMEKGRARFFVSLLFDALAPSNWIFANPAALRKILDTGGENLVKGARNLVHDVRHNHMLPSSVDASPFKVGVNIATTPGHVVFRNEMFELLQYTPTTPQVHRRPLVMSPPQVNKYYAVDLTPEKSLIKWAVDSGVQMFVISWRNPTVEQRHWGLEDYALALDEAVEVARQVTGSPDVNMWGSCAGGMTLAAYLGWLAATGEQHKVANTTWAVCVLDTASALEDTTLGLFNTPSTIRMAKARSATKGVITGPQMASMFAWMRPNDLIWNYWVNNYLLGNKPPAFDILAWNADTTRLPGQFHSDLLDLVARQSVRESGPARNRRGADRYDQGEGRRLRHRRHHRPHHAVERLLRNGAPVRQGIDLRAGQRRAPAEPAESAWDSEVVLLLGAGQRRRPVRMGEACATDAPGRQLVAALARMDPAAVGRTGGRAQAGGLAQASAACAGTWRVRAPAVTVRDIDRKWYSTGHG